MRRLIASLLFLGLTIPAHAAVLTFGEDPLTGPSAYSEDGFVFSSPISDLALMAIFDHVADEVTEFNEIYMHSFAGITISWTVSDATGDLFTMSSFDIDEFDSSGTLTVSSSKGSFSLTSGSGTISAGSDYTASDFTDVAAVTFTLTTTLFGDSEVAIDNLVVTVPEPSSFALCALAGAALYTRRRHAHAPAESAR